MMPARPGLREDAADDLLHLVEFALAHRQRRRELDDRVSAIIGTAVQAAFVHLRGHEVLEDPLGLLLGERLLGVLVLDEFDSVEETLTTDVTDDRQVLELLERVLERRSVLMHVVVELLGLEDVEVRHRRGTGDRVSAEGVAVVERLVAAGSEQTAATESAPSNSMASPMRSAAHRPKAFSSWARCSGAR
jgi:hypothetical protein